MGEWVELNIDNESRPVTTQRRRVLFAEASVVNQFLIEDIFEALNFDVTLVKSAQLAVEEIETTQYDVVLVNVELADLNAAELLAVCRQHENKSEPTSVVGLVDSLEQDAKQSVVDLQLDAYLFQPFDNNSLEQLLMRCSNRPQQVMPAQTGFVAPPLDLSAQHELEGRYQGERRSGLIKLVVTYQELSAELIADLTIAIDNDDTEGCYQAAHSLKSCSANLAALQLSRFCNNLEQTARSAVMEHAPLLLSSIRDEHSRVSKALDCIIKKPLQSVNINENPKVYPPGTLNELVEIMVVDDDPTARMLAKDVLMSNGFNVAVAEDGLKALALMGENQPDLILLDVEMPVLDGFATCEKLRGQQHTAEIPVIMLTGRDDIAAVERSFDVKATDFVSKPVNWLVLVQRIRYILRASETVRQLKESERRLESAQHVAQVGYWDMDIQADCLYVSDSLCRLTGCSREELTTMDDFVKIVAPDDQKRVAHEIETKVLAGHNYKLEYNILTPKGLKRRIEAVGTSTLSNEGEVIWAMGTLQDVTEQREREELIHYQAHHDSLTSLHNRNSFNEQLDQAIKLHKRLGANLAVVYLDLDNFKRVNDSLGHHMGDELLKIFANRLKAEIRDSDFLAHNSVSSIARLGGDEYTLLFSVLDKETDAAIIAQRVLADLAEPFKLKDNRGGNEWHEVFVTASIGIAIYPSDGDTAGELLKNSDTAMYAAKNKGKNSYCFYDHSMNDLSLIRLNMESELRKAVAHNEFFLYYQPKIDLATGKMVSVEALLRWQNDTFGAVSPAEFIPLAEETGLILPISEWVLEEACKQLSAWQTGDLSAISIAVNISGFHFRQGTLEGFVSGLLNKYKLDGQQLELELTEGIIMDDVHKTIDTLGDLKRLGVTISVDDFGTGYSSLNYLKRFPIDILKIDQSFVRDLESDDENAAIVDAIIILGHSLGLKLVAEGVETAAELAYLKTKSCDMVQGYYFSKPVPAEEIVHYGQ